MPRGIYPRTKDMMTGKHQNHKAWNKGKRGIISTKKGKHFEHLQGEKSWKWLGDEVGYHGVHFWVAKHLGKPKMCEKCGSDKKKKYEWANVDHKYKRVLDDYIRLCTQCHRQYDYAKKNSSKF